MTDRLRSLRTVLLLLGSALLGMASAQDRPGRKITAKRDTSERGDFRLSGLHSPATVSGSIFVQAPALPSGSAVKYFVDDQACAETTEAPYAMAAAEGYSLDYLPAGPHRLRAEAILPSGVTLYSNEVKLDLVPSINHRFSASLTAYGNQPTAQSQPLGAILEATSTKGATLSSAELHVRRKVLGLYLNWGIDPSLDSGNDQSDVLLALHPTGWATGDSGKQPLSLRFSADAPFYQAIPKLWPRVALPAGYIRNVQLNTTEEGDGIGFGESVADIADVKLQVQSQWYDDTATRRVFRYRMSPDWAHRLPWQPSGDHHMIFIDPVEETFVSSYMTALDSGTGGVQSLYASSPVKLATMGDHGGSIAAGFAELPAMLQPGEATNPERPIRHALGGSVSRVWAARVYPAHSWDGNLKGSTDSCTGKGYTNTGLVPYGGVIQLDPALDLTALDLTLPALRILQAIQTYGYYIEDYGCSDLDIYTAVPEAEFNPFGGLWGYNRRGIGVQNEIANVLVNSKLYVVAPLTKKQ